MQHSMTTNRPELETDYLKNLDPAPEAPVLFACWQTLTGATVCQTLPTVTTALATSLDGDRFNPYGQIDALPLETALADAVPELCHPEGCQLTGIGLAAAGQGSVALDAWTATEAGRARTWQQHLGGAEAHARVEPDDYALFDVPEARLLTALERLRARATGTAAVLPEPATASDNNSADTNPAAGPETASERLAHLVCRRTLAGIADALITDDEEYLYDDLFRAVSDLDRHEAVIGAELARLDAAEHDRAAGKYFGPLFADPAHVAEIEAAFAGRETAWARLRDLLTEVQQVLIRQR